MYDLPSVGLGVYAMDDEQARVAVRSAAETGYRLFDTAAVYGNEAAVGRGLRESGLRRDEYALVTKLWNDAHGGLDRVLPAARASLDRLGTDVVDLLLIHWPVSSAGRFVVTWEALLAVRELGLARQVGVSNFLPRHLDALAAAGLENPAVNQVECHPWHARDELIAAMRLRGVEVMAWSPLGRGMFAEEPLLVDIAAAHDATPAQVALRWNLQRGVTVIPKSATPQRIAENFELERLRLTADEMARISALDAERSIDDTLYARFQ